jgi:hypothetical protein
MPQTEVMLIGALPAGFPGAGGPNPTIGAPYDHPDWRMNRHMPIPNTWQQPQNLLRVTNKTPNGSMRRASSGRPITSALGSLISPVLHARVAGLGDGAAPAQPAPSEIVDPWANTPAASGAPAMSAAIPGTGWGLTAEQWRSAWAASTTSSMILGGTMAGIHGYRRNHGKAGWTALRVALGVFFPLITNGVAVVQGFGKPAGR